MKKKYMVSISYIKMIFNGKFEAIDFADKAFEALEERDRDVTVKIVMVEEEGNA